MLLVARHKALRILLDHVWLHELLILTLTTHLLRGCLSWMLAESALLRLLV